MLRKENAYKQNLLSAKEPAKKPQGEGRVREIRMHRLIGAAVISRDPGPLNQDFPVRRCPFLSPATSCTLGTTCSLDYLSSSSIACTLIFSSHSGMIQSSGPCTLFLGCWRLLFGEETGARRQPQLTSYCFCSNLNYRNPPTTRPRYIFCRHHIHDYPWV